MRPHHLSRHPVPVLSHPQRKEVSSHAQLELSVAAFVALFPCHWAPLSLAPSSWQLPYGCSLIRSSLNFLFSRASRPSPLSLSSYERCSSLFIILQALCWMHSRSSRSLLSWTAQNWTQHAPCEASLGWSRWGRWPSSTCWQCSSLRSPGCHLLSQPEGHSAGQHGSHQNLHILLCRAPSLYWCVVFFFSWCRTPLVPLLNVQRLYVIMSYKWFFIFWYFLIASADRESCQTWKISSH